MLVAKEPLSPRCIREGRAVLDELIIVTYICPQSVLFCMNIM